MRKKWLWFPLLLALALLLGCLLFTGGERADIYPYRYAVSEDGRSMTLSVGVASSIGYVRRVRTRTEGDGVYLTFYSTFGFNSSWGAKDTFTIDLPEGCRELYFTRGRADPFLVFTLSPETGRWESPSYLLPEG